MPATQLVKDIQKATRQGYVRVPDGRIAKVIGYYRRPTESVLVKFASGETKEFLTSEIELHLAPGR